MKTLIAICILTAACFTGFAKTSTPAGWLDDFDAALEKASAEKKLVLVDFSGSDWCGWCKRLDSEVFDTDEFRKGAAKKFVLLMIDSPSDKSKLSAKAKTQNPELCKKYAVRGFPTVLILDSTGKEIHRTGYRKGGPKEYLEMLFEATDMDAIAAIKPVTDIFNEFNQGLEKEMNAAMEEARASISSIPVTATDEARKEARKKSFELLIDRQIAVLRKYVASGKVLAEKANACKVPDKYSRQKLKAINKHRQDYQRLVDMLKHMESRGKL